MKHPIRIVFCLIHFLKLDDAAEQLNVNETSRQDGSLEILPTVVSCSPYVQYSFCSSSKFPVIYELMLNIFHLQELY